MSNKLTNKPVNVQNIEQFTEHEQGKEMNNEPVAWRYKYEDDDTAWNYQDNKILMKSMIRVHHVIAEPLYAHPAKTIKNLTDGELPVLTVTVLDCNGKLIRSVVSFKETRIICDSLVDELKKANEK